jgi:hypothetical protein
MAISRIRQIASVIVGGIGLVFLVPPVYVTILDWRGWSNELAFSQLFALLPCCSIPAALCFAGAWLIRRRR